MKKLLISLLLVIGFVSMTNAQWVSPGNGLTYYMDDLVAEGAAIGEGGSQYLIVQDITISEGDIWLIEEDAEVSVALKNSFITIQGTMRTSGRVNIDGDNASKIRFENAVRCNFENTTFRYLSGINIVESHVDFTDCAFISFDTGYTSAAVSMYNCDPEFHMCQFENNEGSAIGSAANGQSSPQIVGCVFRNNVTANTNYPQINLGPGNPDKSILINSCDVIGGGYSMVGGISINDILQVSSTTAVISYNNVTGNRYGYNQQGYNIASNILHNVFANNDTETNPMNGGSGISIYGLNDGCTARLRHNTITENLWGITSININSIDMGNELEWGFNQIFKNSNSSGEYDLYNNSTCDITAIGNYWGTTNESEVEAHIYHQNDDASLGLVTFRPIWNIDGIEEPSCEPVEDNRIYTLEGRYLGTELPEGFKGVYIRNGKKFFSY